MHRLARYAVPAVCLATIVGCSRRNVIDHENRDKPNTIFDTDQDLDRPRDPAGTTTVTGANVGSVPIGSALDRIAAARCARESACNNIGAEKRFASSDACSQKLHADLRGGLSAKECPRGVDSSELGECLEAIQKEDCNSPIDAIGRVAACRSSDLCSSTDVPNR